MSRTTKKINTAVRTTEQTVRAASGFVGFVWRHRVGLGPILVGLAVFLTALMMGWFVRDPFYVYGSIFLGTALMLTWIHFGVSDHEGKTHAMREQLHFYAVTVTSSVCLTVYYQYVLPGAIEFRDALVIFGWLVAILGAPWWWNLRRRSRVALENDLDAWPILVEGTQLLGTWWSGYKKTNDGWTGLLHIPGKMPRKSALEAGELIEGLTNSPADSIVIEPAGRNANLVRVTCIQQDPHSERIDWDGKSLRSIKDMALLGKYTDHSVERTRWFEDGVGAFHRMLGGVQRSGKSGLMHLLFGLYGPADDVVIWSIDLKGGTALLPWAPLADWTATTIEEACYMVECAAQMVNARAHVVARKQMPNGVIQVSSKYPAVIIMCDEIASLIGDGVDQKIARRAEAAMVEVGRKGGGMGIIFVLATQYPTLGALRNSQLKSQLTWRACFRLAEPNQGHFILPNMHKGVDPYKIPVDRRGTCYIDAQGVFRHSTLRVVYVDHSQIRPVVDRYWQTTPTIDAGTLNWDNKELVTVYQNRKIWTPQMLDGLMDDDENVADMYDDTDDVNYDGVIDSADAELEALLNEESPIREAVEQRDAVDPKRGEREARERAEWLKSHQEKPEAEARRLMYEALRKAPVEGLGPRQLSEICKRRERTIHRWLREDEANDVVVRRSYGRYVMKSSL